VRILLGISGASGAVYGVRTASVLLGQGVELHLAITATGWEILARETGGPLLPDAFHARREWLAGRIGSDRPFTLWAEDDYGIPFASGSNPPDALIIAPCSMGMLGRIAHGISSSALARCADVALKERAPLVLVPRETPLSAIHLENMLTLARAGAFILPACPAFYHRPETVGEVVDFVVSRILARVGIDAGLVPRWGEEAAGPQTVLSSAGTPVPGRRKF
jgi:4-hydroxy-3-polyprenylbenzoate decarboxylase